MGVINSFIYILAVALLQVNIQSQAQCNNILVNTTVFIYFV